ncbi:MAG: hypothetical protein ABIX37_10110, partial [Gammaproteobacteria bacterium]
MTISLPELQRALRVTITTLALAGITCSPSFAAPAFVQLNYGTESPARSVAVTMAKPQGAGNLNVVAVGWYNSTSSVVSVADSAGNAYRQASPPTILSGVATQVIYYAENIRAVAAGANTVTVILTADAQYVDVRVAEYSGLATSGALDRIAGGTGTGALTTSGQIVTTNANDLLIG